MAKKKKSSTDDREVFIRGAELSKCRTYRYCLWRRWAWGGEQVMFIGLNPSTADHTQDDPTIRRCIWFAKSWGFSGLVMTNVFAFRTTVPAELDFTADIVGPSNDEVLAEQKDKVSLIVAAWGAHCPKEREEEVCRVIGSTIHCLGVTKDGRPRHPLYLPKTTGLRVFKDQFAKTYKGWRIVRKTGEEMKCRGRARMFYGFEATHIDTGYVEYFHPSPDGDLPIEIVERALDVKNELLEVTGKF